MPTDLGVIFHIWNKVQFFVMRFVFPKSFWEKIMMPGYYIILIYKRISALIA